MFKNMPCSVKRTHVVEPFHHATLTIVAAIMVVAATIGGLKQPSERVSHIGDETAMTVSAGIDIPSIPRELVDHLTNHYRVPNALVERIIALVWSHAPANDFDPLLILVLIGVESSLNPSAVSSAGAEGLMQVMPQVHSARVTAHGQRASLFDPEVNIQIGVSILRDMVAASNGELSSALQRYNGALRDPTAQFSQRVLGEHTRLKAVVQLQI